jgi:hypothetical protein
MALVHCPYCGHDVQLIFVHSHYQCPVCGANIMPCCDGEQASETSDNKGAPNASCNKTVPGNNDIPEKNEKKEPD